MNYKSRAAFKLMEIQNKYKILKKGQKAIDIGSAPGGWSQVISELISSNKSQPDVIAVDILRMEPLDGVLFIQGDLTRKEIQDKILEKNNYEKFDVVLSDMCPEFIGQKHTDHFNLIKLNEMTIEFTSKILKTNGILVMKTFEGSMQKKLQQGIEIYFEKIQRFKPASSRSESSEMYLICTGYMQGEKLKSEIEKLEKTDVNELIEKKKAEALKTYKFSKFDEEFDQQKLRKMREDIINIFKIDPDNIEVTKEEEEEIRKILEKEKKEVNININLNFKLNSYNFNSQKNKALAYEEKNKNNTTLDNNDNHNNRNNNIDNNNSTRNIRSSDNNSTTKKILILKENKNKKNKNSKK